jgi:hypothetical protein
VTANVDMLPTVLQPTPASFGDESVVVAKLNVPP